MDTPPVVLIVDDSEMICWLLAECLGRLGYRTLLARSAPEAEQRVARIGLDGLALALLDVYLDREASGYTLYEQWRAECPSLPIVLMSGAPDAPSLPAVAQGRVPLIAKPFDLDLVLPQLATLAERRSPDVPSST